MRLELPPAPEDHLHFKPDRHEHATTSSHGIDYRFARQRPRKLPVLHPADPHPATTAEAQPEPLWWQKPITNHIQTSTSTLNLENLRQMARDHITDPTHLAYMLATYTHGGSDHCDLPRDAQRFRVKNSVIPGTDLGNAWDDLIDYQAERGRILELPAPLIAGTVVNPMGCTEKVKVATDGTETLKQRPHIDGRATRTEHRNLGAHNHPRNRQCTQESIHDTICAIIANNTAYVNVFDYEAFYLHMPRSLQSTARNCMFWKRRGAAHPTFIYGLDNWFGQVPTPSTVERHADLLQRAQAAELAKAAGHPVHISRRTDDSITHLTAEEVHRAYEFSEVFLSVCRRANQPIQSTKVLMGVSIFKFDSFVFDLNHCPDNRYGVHPGAVGIDVPRAKKMRAEVLLTIKGSDRKAVERLVGKLEWVSTVVPHIRSMVNTVRRAMYSVTQDNDLVPVEAETRTDLQRLESLFLAPKLTPFWKIYKLTPPQIDAWTDASGYDCFGGYTDGLFWTEPLADHQVLDTELRAKGPKDEQLSLSTAYLELISLYCLLVTLGRRARGKVLRWTTDAQASVANWIRQSSKNHATNRLLSLIGDYCTRNSILVEARWWPREQNTLADLLTHADISSFCRLARVSPIEQVRVPRHAVQRAGKLPTP